MIGNKKLAKKLKGQRSTAKRSLTLQYDNTKSCIDFYNGDFMAYRDRIQFLDTNGARRRAMVQFNKVKPNVDAVVGFAAQNRRKIKYAARMNATAAQNLFSRYMDAMSEHTRDEANADQVETQQDLDMFVNGYGAVETDISYLVGNATTDPNGEILMERIDPQTIGWDAHSTAQNLQDARFIYYWKDYDLKEALDLFEDSNPDDFERVADDGLDSGYQYNPYGGLYDKIKMDNSVEWSNKNEELVRVHNHQWFEYETFYKSENPIYILTNPDAVLVAQAKLQVIAEEARERRNKGLPDGIEASDMFDFDPTAQELTFDNITRRRMIEEFGDIIDIISFQRKCFYTAVCSGDHIFSKFKSLSQQAFSIQVKTGTYDAANKMWVGMVNSMMEPTKYYSKVLTELLFTIASNSKGGVMVEEDAVEDLQDFESKWAKTDAVIKVRSGTLGAGKIQEKAKGQVPTGLENMITLTDQAISDTSGIDRAFLGTREDSNESGILYRRRIRQIISTMARYFDSITLYQKMQGRLLADFIPVWAENNEGGMIKIIGEDGAEQFVQISSDKFAAEYDVTIQEAPLSPEEQQEIALVLSTQGDKFMATGAITEAKAFYLEALQYLNINADTKTRLAEALQPQETVPITQLQQLQSQLDAALAQLRSAETRKDLSTAALNEAKAETERAKTVDTLESARQTALENDLVMSDEYTSVKVTI